MKRLGKINRKPVVEGNPNKLKPTDITLKEACGCDNGMKNHNYYKIWIPENFDLQYMNSIVPIIEFGMNNRILSYIHNNSVISGPIFALCKKDDNSNLYTYSIDGAIEALDKFLYNPNTILIQDTVYNSEFYICLPDSYRGYDKYWDNGKWVVDVVDNRSYFVENPYITQITEEEYLQKLLDANIYELN